jgi:hypothetical protein
MNFASKSLPYLGSGRIVRFGACVLLDIALNLYCYDLGRLVPYLERP